MNNIICSGMDGVGKTTLADKLVKKYNLNIIHSTSKTRNDFNYHIDLLDYHENTFFDRFHIGELVFPYVYNREPKLTLDEFDKITQRIIDNNDLYIIMISSDPSILIKRLQERGEDSAWEIETQTKYYNQAIERVKKFNYKNFYVCDIAQPNAYEKLDKWIDEHFGKMTVNTAYRKLCKDLYEKGHVMETRNIRGGTKELCNYMFTIDDLDQEYVSLKEINTNLTYTSAEILWYMSSRNDTAFISKFGKMWEKLSDDGVTNNSAYGYLLQEKHGFNQIDKICELLTIDPYSRRAVMNINVPNKNVIETKDEPCTICLIYQIRENKLHCTCMMRSNDIMFGLRNDLPYFITLQKYIANRLGKQVGTYTHMAASIHYYDKDEKKVKDTAYGTMEQIQEKLDIPKLLENQDELIYWVDHKFTTKDDFTQLLKDKEIIK